MSGYDFSQIYHATSVIYSPGASFVATAVQNRLIIRSASTLQIVRTYQCLIPSNSPFQSISSSKHASTSQSASSQEVRIDHIEWSSDSMYLLAFCAKESMVWIFGLAVEGNGIGGEVGRICGEVEGIVRVEWGMGDGREIITWSDHGLRLTIHSLTTGEAKYIQHPKSPYDCHTYSPDHRYLAVAELHSGKDRIGIYDVHQAYSLVRHFAVGTVDLQGLSWSPCGKWLAMWDTCIQVSMFSCRKRVISTLILRPAALADLYLQYSLHIHSPLGPHLSTFSPAAPSFSLTNAEDPGLGIQSIVWSPSGRWLLMVGFDSRVRVLESDGWGCVGVFGGSSRADRAVNLWREPNEWIRETRGRGIVQFGKLKTPATVPNTRIDHSKPLPRSPIVSIPRSGVAQLSFDPDGCLLFVRQENQPNVVQIWTFLPEPTSETPEIKLKDVIILEKSVSMVKWCPVDGRDRKGGQDIVGASGRKLACVSRSGGVYVWNEQRVWVEDGDGEGVDEKERGGMVEGVGIPTRVPFHTHDLAWSPDGTSLILQDKTQFRILYDDPAEADGASRRWDQQEGLTEVVEEDEEEEQMSLYKVRRGVDGVEGWRSNLLAGITAA